MSTPDLAFLAAPPLFREINAAAWQPKPLVVGKMAVKPARKRKRANKRAGRRKAR